MKNNNFVITLIIFGTIAVVIGIVLSIYIVLNTQEAQIPQVSSQSDLLNVNEGEILQELIFSESISVVENESGNFDLYISRDSDFQIVLKTDFQFEKFIPSPAYNAVLINEIDPDGVFTIALGKLPPIIENTRKDVYGNYYAGEFVTDKTVLNWKLELDNNSNLSMIVIDPDSILFFKEYKIEKFST